MCLVWLRRVLWETNSCWAISGPVSALSSSRSTCSSRLLRRTCWRSAPALVWAGAATRSCVSPTLSRRCARRVRASPSLDGAKKNQHRGRLRRERAGRTHLTRATRSGLVPAPPGLASMSLGLEARACSMRISMTLPILRDPLAVWRSRSQQVHGVVHRGGVLAVAMLRDEQPNKSQMVELALKAEVVRGGDAVLTCPASSIRQAGPARFGCVPSSPRSAVCQGRSRADSSVEAWSSRSMAPLWLPTAASDPCHGDEPPMLVLRRCCSRTERLRGLEVAGGVCEVSQLAVQLAQPDVQIGHGQRRGRALGSSISIRGLRGVRPHKARAPGRVVRRQATCRPERRCCSTRRRGSQPTAGSARLRRTSGGLARCRRSPRLRARGSAAAEPRARWSSGPAMS